MRSEPQSELLEPPNEIWSPSPRHSSRGTSPAQVAWSRLCGKQRRPVVANLSIRSSPIQQVRQLAISASRPRPSIELAGRRWPLVARVHQSSRLCPPVGPRTNLLRLAQFERLHFPLVSYTFHSWPPLWSGCSLAGWLADGRPRRLGSRLIEAGSLSWSGWVGLGWAGLGWAGSSLVMMSFDIATDTFRKRSKSAN